MTYQMREGVSFCRAGSRHFFLDRRANRYFALGDRDEERFASLVYGPADIASDSELSAALSQLLIRQGRHSLAPFALRHPPCKDLNFPAATSANLWLLGQAIAALVRVKLAMRWRDTGRMLENFARYKAASPGRQESDAQLLELAAAFERIRAWTREDQCLPLSLAFGHVASGMGFDIDIVFGITPRPFGAHCWVQRGATVLNDRLTRIAAFTPIYAL